MAKQTLTDTWIADDGDSREKDAPILVPAGSDVIVQEEFSTGEGWHHHGRMVTENAIAVGARLNLTSMERDKDIASSPVWDARMEGDSIVVTTNDSRYSIEVVATPQAKKTPVPLPGMALLADIGQMIQDALRRY